MKTIYVTALSQSLVTSRNLLSRTVSRWQLCVVFTKTPRYTSRREFMWFRTSKSERPSKRITTIWPMSLIHSQKPLLRLTVSILLLS